MASFLSAVSKAGPGTRFELVAEPSGRVVVPDLEVAVDSATRKKGLLGRDGLADGSGLVIAPTNAVHTFFMRFPIDIVFVTRAGRGREDLSGCASLAHGSGVARLRGGRVGRRAGRPARALVWGTGWPCKKRESP